jgi:MazG family protein
VGADTDLAAALTRLDEITRRLRRDCPWDRDQDERSIVPHTVEEAYELADAAHSGDDARLLDELGDVLFQVYFLALLLEERGQGDLAGVADHVREKLIRRHPHVFGDADYRTSEEQIRAWEEVKAAERARKGRATSLLDEVPKGLPALTRAVKLTARAARVGFDWPNAEHVIGKLHEELAELQAEIASGDRAKMRDELGDILFVVANLARKLDLEPEDALRSSNAKFARRFRYIEQRLAERGKTPDQSDLAEMDALWDEVRAADKG